MSVQMQGFPRMPQRPRVAIQQVMKEQHLCAEDFFSTRREGYLVNARRLAAERLMDLGYSATQIGRFLGRDHTTVLNYLPKGAETRAARHAAQRVMRNLQDTENRIILDLAKARGISPAALIAEWVHERIEGMMS